MSEGPPRPEIGPEDDALVISIRLLMKSRGLSLDQAAEKMKQDTMQAAEGTEEYLQEDAKEYLKQIDAAVEYIKRTLTK